MTVDRTLIDAGSGRMLDLYLAGPASGSPVIVHHGTPATGDLFVGWVEHAERLGIRLIGYSRPGYGRSTRVPGRSVAQAAADARAIASRLGIARFATWGYSGGGPHALACAALLPELVSSAAVVACPAPYGAEGLDYLQGMGEDNVREFGVALEGEAALRPLHVASVAAMRQPGADFAELMASILSPEDREVIRGALGGFLAGMMKDAFTAGADGWIDDDLAFVRPWGFELREISVPLQLWQGGQDLMVPREHGRWLAGVLPAVEVHQDPAWGHMTLLTDKVGDCRRGC